MGESGGPLYLTTREVAGLLRVKERKVYDLAAAGEIPHRRITGKLLFPRSEIHAWIEGGHTAPAAAGAAAEGPRPAVLAGSHDPLLDWAVREAECGLATLLNGSHDGLDAFAEGRAALAGLHIPEDRNGAAGMGWNIRSVEARGLGGCVLIGWAARARGLLLARGTGAEVRRLADLRGRRIVLRQPGAGAATLMQRLLAEAGLGPADFTAAAGLARTESDAAAAVASGEAEAALGIEAMARQFDLPFRPLVAERFDLLVDRRAFFTPPVQRLMAFARGPRLAEKAAAMGGYDLSGLGAVRWLSP
ncbi:helix-turn-helix transcriptional regulator [Paralimibaculum aggregatum]|nr:helix-turn-helix transcriptional regulator [Limibaculum sp. NKW23]